MKLTALILAALINAISSLLANASDQRPNIVLIMADDLSHRNVGAYGAMNFATPNLDQLAAGGMRFDYCFSLPLCTPSRVELMTGQYNGRNFFRASTLEADQRTFGHVAKAAGYATCVVGKWKLTGKNKKSTPDQFGFDEHCVTEGQRNDSPRYKNPEILRNGKVEKYNAGEYGPDVVCDYSLNFIERNKEKPFLLYYPMVLVHSPLSPVPGSPGYDAADQRTDDQDNYPAMVRRMDENVGRIIAKLSELGLREQTLILFTGDNGSKQSVEMKMKDGTVYPGGKGHTNDTGVHVPLIMNQPGRVPAGVSNALVSFTDFVPTVAEVIGVKLTPETPCDGQSFLAHGLGKKEAAGREWIYQWFANNPQEDKVIEFAFDREFRLYNDGRFYHWSADLLEAKPLLINALDGAAKSAHDKLNKALLASRAALNRPSSHKTEANAGFKAAGQEFVWVEGGEFMAGAKDNASNPSRKSVVADGFWTSKYEVTQEMYLTTMGVNPSTQKAEGHPVETVSWHDAREYCRRLTESLRASQVLPDGYEVRLPSSTEWEWAARGGVKNHGYLYSGGDDAKMIGWIREESPKGHQRVGTKQSNELGLYDMTGNVWEWCFDALPADLTGKPGTDTRVKRGGSFFNNTATVLVTNIGEMEPSGSGPRYGFRVVIAKPIKPTVTSATQPAPAVDKRPNMLWIVTDDQRFDSIAAFNRARYGISDSPLGQVFSPNLDRLAAMGTTFINSFNHNPCCQPSRTIMHTGRYSHRTGVYGFEYYNPTGMAHWQPMVPEILRDQAGYQSVSVGKIGLYAQQFSSKKNANGSVLYETNLGYRDEFAAKGLVDWHVEKKGVDGKKGAKSESFFFPDGKSLIWSEQGGVASDNAVIQQRLNILRAYDNNGGTSGEEGGEIIGGVNPQPNDRTRDANYSLALQDHMAHAGKEYTDVLGRKQNGPDPAKPLFLYCGFEFPHTPVLPPAEFREKFANMRFKIPTLTEEERAQFPPQVNKLFKIWETNHFTDDEKQQMVADYYAYCAYGDSLVGKLADEFIKHSENSKRPWMILYVCGDNGWKLNDHGMGAKFTHFDQDLINPIIVISSNKQRFPAGKVVTDFVGFVDMAPTFLAAGGIDTSVAAYDYLDGRDLAQTVAGTQRPRDYMIAEPTWVIGPRAVIRTKEFKFAMRIRPRHESVVTAENSGKNIDWAIKAEFKDIEPTLFDLNADPNETKNIAFDPKYRPILDAMRAKLQNIVLGDARVEVAWTKAGGDTVHISNFAPGADDGILQLPELKP